VPYKYTRNFFVIALGMVIANNNWHKKGFFLVQEHPKFMSLSCHYLHLWTKQDYGQISRVQYNLYYHTLFLNLIL
jgi:hypothetical protein